MDTYIDICTYINIYIYIYIESKESQSSYIIWEREDFRKWKIIKDKREHYIIIRWSILQQLKIILNMHTQNKAPKCVKQKLTQLNKEVDKSIIRVIDFNIP
jgi:hypothetical protein